MEKQKSVDIQPTRVESIGTLTSWTPMTQVRFSNGRVMKQDDHADTPEAHLIAVCGMGR